MALESLPKIAPALFSPEQDLIEVYNKKTGTVGVINPSYIKSSPSGSAGAIQFSDGSAFSSDSNLFWDDTNKRLGIGTNAPISKMHIAGLSTFVGASGSTLGSTAANAAAQFYQTGFTGVLAIGGYSNGGGEIQSYQSGGASLGGTILLQRQTGNVLIGSASDTAKLSIKGSGSTSATTSLLVQNSAGTNIFKIGDGARIDILGTIGQIDFSSYYQLFSTGNQSTVGCYKGGQAFSVDGSRLCVNVATGSHSASASFQVDSTTTGILPPRMTTTQINAIASPAEGLVAYNTDINHLCCYQNGAWVKFNHSPM